MSHDGTPSKEAEGMDHGPMHALLEDMLRRRVMLPADFEQTVSDLAARAYAKSSHLAWRERRPLPTENMIETALATVLRGSNTLAGGGASGYLAVIAVFLEMMRADYPNAETIVFEELFLKRGSAGPA